MNDTTQNQQAAKNGISSRIGFPVLLSALFFLTASLPVDLLGCRNRGLIAVAIALVGGLLGIAAAVKGLFSRANGKTDSLHHILTALIYAIPVIYTVLITR